VLAARGLAAENQLQEYLQPRLSRLPAASSLAGLSAAVERLSRALEQGEGIAVYGDYDADGITAAALAVVVLKALGGQVQPWLANRFDWGYGLAPEAVEQMAAQGRTVLLVVDCGTSDRKAVERARELGLDVVVVDHHPPSNGVPPVEALVNPFQPGCSFPDKGMASVGLVFYVMAALRTARGHPMDMRPLLDLVALGTVADVAPMGGINRILVRRGLEQLGTGPRKGLAALQAVAGVKAPLTAESVGFRLGPRINAAGRLGSPDLALELLLAQDEAEALRLALALDQLSQERREVQQTIIEAAQPAAERQAKAGAPIILVAGQGWHQGVIGIVAARLCDEYDRPAGVVGLEGDQGRGSMRAPPGTNLHQALCACDEHLIRFGGHAAAAGFSVRADQVEALAEAMGRALEQQVADSEWPPPLPVDAEALQGELTLPVGIELEGLGPFGLGNPEPAILVSRARVLRADVRNGGHISLLLDAGGMCLRAFGPTMAADWPHSAPFIDSICHLRRNSFRGLDQAELRLIDARVAQD
jgi:single-stranded-DNA-specific exonuclease